MRTGALVVLSLAAVVLDSSVAPEIEILGARPDFVVLIVAYTGLLMGARPATIVGFLLGLVLDSEQPEYFGLHALALSAIGYVTAVAWEHLVRGSVFVQIAVLFSASLLHDGIYYIVYYRNHPDMFLRFIARFGFLGGVYTAALAVVIFTLARAQRWRRIAGGTRV